MTKKVENKFKKIRQKLQKGKKKFPKLWKNITKTSGKSDKKVEIKFQKMRQSGRNVKKKKKCMCEPDQNLRGARFGPRASSLTHVT